MRTVGYRYILTDTVNGKDIPQGQVMRLSDGLAVHRRDVTSRMRWRTPDGYSVNDSVLEHLEFWKVNEVHYYEDESGILFVAPVPLFRVKGIHRESNGRWQYILPRQRWTESDNDYDWDRTAQLPSFHASYRGE
jgi:hypothetical protein